MNFLFKNQSHQLSQSWRIWQIVAGGCLLGLLAVGVTGWWLFQPVSRQEVKSTRFVIPKGQAVTMIGQRLTNEGYLKHPWVFRFTVRWLKLESRLQAGSFLLSSHLTPGQIALALTEGTNDLWFTIPEGWRSEEIAESLNKLGLDQFDSVEFLLLAKPDEGRLFPDTYLIPRDFTATQIHGLLTRTFDQRVSQNLTDQIDQNQRDFDQILTMASLVEREAREYEQMRHIAGILWNRIDLGMPLQVDATLQYLAAYDPVQKTWWAPPGTDLKQLNSPFNTYLQIGLPPQPIANPGLAAIRATLNSLPTDDLFYLHARDGQVYYAQDLKTHTTNVERYLR